MTVKRKIITTLFAVIALFLVLSILLPLSDTVNATVVFTDDFEDGNYDGWTITGIYRNASDNLRYLIPGNFTVVDGTLKAIGPVGNETHWLKSQASIPSSTAYGTWTFDLFIVDNPDGLIVFHIISDAIAPPETLSAFPPPHSTALYDLVITTHNLTGESRPSIYLYRYLSMSFAVLDQEPLGSPFSILTNVWNHIEVTRNTTGYFNVYLNDTLKLSAQDNHITTSNYFTFLAESGQAIDNVTIDADPVSPSAPPEMTLILIGVSISAIAVIIILIVIYMRRRR